MYCIDLPGSPQRVNGKVKGRIFVGNNPIPVTFENTDLHSYVVMNQGRAYTAISTIPETLGYSLLPLASIGGIIGWMFAVEQQGYKNGFSVTGNYYIKILFKNCGMLSSLLREMCIQKQYRMKTCLFWAANGLLHNQTSHQFSCLQCIGIGLFNLPLLHKHVSLLKRMAWPVPVQGRDY